jgi:hypothetical protein
MENSAKSMITPSKPLSFHGEDILVNDYGTVMQGTVPQMKRVMDRVSSYYHKTLRAEYKAAPMERRYHSFKKFRNNTKMRIPDSMIYTDDFIMFAFYEKENVAFGFAPNA